MKYDITLEELDRLLAENESFYGTKPNFENIRRYKKLKAELIALMKKARNFRKLEELPPERDHRHAVISLEYDTLVMMGADVFPHIRNAMNLCDGFTVTTCGRFPAMSFTIMDTWEM